MRTIDTPSLFANPIQDWTELVMKTGEMMMASAQVIGHRTNRMATVGPNPSEHDCREFALMGQEKFDAAAESAQAMAEQMLTMNLHLWTRGFGLMFAGMTDMMALAASRSMGESLTRQATLVHTMSQSADTASQLSSSVARLANSGLQPIHLRAVENGRRLANG